MFQAIIICEKKKLDFYPKRPSHQVGKGGVKEHPINSNQQQIAREIQQRASEINASADDSESAPFNFQVHH